MLVIILPKVVKFSIHLEQNKKEVVITMITKLCNHFGVSRHRGRSIFAAMTHMQSLGATLAAICGKIVAFRDNGSCEQQVASTGSNDSLCCTDTKKVSPSSSCPLRMPPPQKLAPGIDTSLVEVD